ncbi:MAG: HNH endonuclease [Burkholderiales bacterium]|nr:HNH endonuclease [Burkholderiales bacterium]
MKVRRRILGRDAACVDCGRVSPTNQIDHEIPRSLGGSNDDSNLRVRCVDCHKEKTAREASARAGRGG